MKHHLKHKAAAKQGRYGVLDSRTHFLVKQWLMKVYLNPCRTLGSAPAMAGNFSRGRTAGPIRGGSKNT